MEADVDHAAGHLPRARPPDEDADGARRGGTLLAPLRCTGIKPHFLDKLAANNVICRARLLRARGRDCRPAFARLRVGGARREEMSVGASSPRSPSRARGRSALPAPAPRSRSAASTRAPIPSVRLTRGLVAGRSGRAGAGGERARGGRASGLRTWARRRRRAAVDRSQSMAGRTLAQRARGRAHLSSAEGVPATGSGWWPSARARASWRAFRLRRDSDASWARMARRPQVGTALYDAVVGGATAPPRAARRPGDRPASPTVRTARLRRRWTRRSTAARHARPLVYAVGIDGPAVRPGPLRELARAPAARYVARRSSASSRSSTPRSPSSWRAAGASPTSPPRGPARRSP